MPEASQSLVLAACAVVLLAAPAAAQIPQPVVNDPPPGVEFLPRFDFHLTIYKFSPVEDPAERFSWDSHFGGSVDLVDYVYGRASLTIDYEAVMGSELRPFDPNQGNYTMEGALSGRAGDTEIAAVFHHFSRHLSDRPKLFAVAWNTLGGRVMRRVPLGKARLDADVDIGHVIQHSFVDYTWIGQLGLQIRGPITPRVGAFVRGTGQMFDTNGTFPDHGRQFGGMAEAGFAIEGGKAVLELFAGVERRIDAYPVERIPRQWGLAGFRLISR